MDDSSATHSDDTTSDVGRRSVRAAGHAGAGPAIPIFALPVAEAVRVLGTDLDAGLTSADARRRLAADGPNSFEVARPVSRWRLLAGQFADPVVYLLVVAIAVSLIVWLVDGGDGVPLDAVVIVAIVLLNAGVGFVQESRAEGAVAALKDLTRSEATVIRDGAPARIATSDLVRGDVVQLAEGDAVPADARLLEAVALRVGEAPLTGESEPVMKATEAVPAGTVVADRLCMVHRGTAVVAGRGRAVVSSTGLQTEVGRIATLLTETEQEPTPLENEIDRVGRLLGAAVVTIAVGVVATLILVDGLRTGSELMAALLIGVSLAVAAVPEGLPAVLSVVLALGVQRMSRRNALVKRLVSVEALGSATVICSDKTGTLTRNEMMVRRIVVPSGQVEVSGSGYEPLGSLTIDGDEVIDHPDVEEEVRWALIAGGLASDAALVADDVGTRVVGDPTEAALLAAQPKAGIDSALVARRFERRSEMPFSSERKRMTTLQADHERGGRLLLATKGAPEAVLDRCRFERRAGRDAPITIQGRQRWSDLVDELASGALRVLAIACRALDSDRTDLDGSAEEDLVLLGLVGIIDSPREEAKRAIDDAHRAGIRVAMVTGDHPGTASQIAAELGIHRVGDPVVAGWELESATDDELIDLVDRATVFARVEPEHKLRIVNALQAGGHVVAMTGDGVNDAPALSAANIGVAMGMVGTDVSKEAADVILTDDNFATIVTAVSEGRAIFHNIRSFLRYLLSSNIGEVLTVFLGVVGAAAIGLTAEGDELASPLLAVQILWINLMTDSGPALALGVDPPLSGLMDRRPRRLTDRIIDLRMQSGIALVGLTMAVATLAMLDLRLPGGFLPGDSDLATARTAAFTVLVLAQLFNTFNARSDTESVVGQFLVNRWLLAAIVLSLLLQVAVVYLPLLNEAFGTVPLALEDWLIATALASSVLWTSEIRKYLVRRRTPERDLD